MPVVSVANMKGGVGKTTVAVNLAYTLARRFEDPVLLIDMDPQFNATQCFLSGEKYSELLAQGQPTVLHIFLDGDELVPSVVHGPGPVTTATDPDRIIYRYGDRLHIILGDLNLYRLEFGQGMGRERRLARFIREHDLEARYRYIIVDCPPTPSPWVVSSLLASTYYLIPVKAEPLSSVGIDLFQGFVRRVNRNHGHQVLCAGVILTMVERTTRAYRETRLHLENHEEIGPKLFAHEILKRTAIAQMQQRQEFMLDGDDELREMIVNVTQEFRRKVS